MTQTALQPYTGDEEKFEVERQRLLAAYNASEKLAKWTAKDRSGRSVIIQYYPANWRLYELRLRYPFVTIESEIVHMNEEKDLIIIKAWIFTGATYAESYGPGHKRASGIKQGKISMLDKVETGAKARAAREFGIGTEHALDMDDGEIEASVTVIEPSQQNSHAQDSRPRVDAASVTPQPKNPVDELKREAMTARFITGKNAEDLLKAWKDRLRAVFQRDVTDDDLLESEALRATLRAAIERYVKRNAETATSGK